MYQITDEARRKLLDFWLDYVGELLTPITIYDPYGYLGKGDFMNKVTDETRRESYGAAMQDAAARRRVILEILTENKKGMTAREVAGELHRRGITPTDERNYAAPRLTELYKAGKITTTGKKSCPQTGRNVAVWAVKE